MCDQFATPLIYKAYAINMCSTLFEHSSLLLLRLFSPGRLASVIQLKFYKQQHTISSVKLFCTKEKVHK
jgi:hypothetical protein